ncbi:MAG: hypothetical protein DUD32_12480 [Lactobacillus sp.]|nr:MAG: hypothetical protein DUD32_12480 [Lactobacillus sp.]
MQLYVLDRSKNVLATTDGFYNDLHHKELTAGASTYVFDLNKSDEATQYMISGNIITMLDDQGRPWPFEILYYDEYQTYKTVHCEDVGINLFNKACDVWYYTDAKPFAEYFNVITDGTPWELGVNQLADLSRALTFTGRDTGLGRLLSVLKAFDDAECIFNIQMNGPVPVKYVIDVYKKIGTVQDNIQITYNEELDNIQKTETRQEFVTALAGVGSVIEDTETDADGSTVDTNKPQEYVDFIDLEYDDGDFYTTKGDKFLRARTANAQFNPGDQGYIEDFYEYDTKSSAELFNRTLTQIQTRSQPQFTYDAQVKVIDPNLDIGDTVTIIDHDYNPALYLQARVATLEKSYTDATKGSITFTNYVVLTDTVTQQIAALRTKVNGIKNGSTSYVWIRYADDDQGTNMSQSPKDKAYVAIVAKVNQPVPSDDPADYAGHWQRLTGEQGIQGIQGKDGKQGIPGTNGRDGTNGVSTYVHMAYANSADGATGFNLAYFTNAQYIGLLTDTNQADSTDYKQYTWSRLRGMDGTNGTDGTPGKPGTDGRTPYFHVAYSNSADGATDFTVQNPDGKQYAYMGTYVDYTQADSTEPTTYSWSLVKGPQGNPGQDGSDGQPGEKGIDGKTSYFHTAWADSADGKDGFYVGGNRNYFVDSAKRTAHPNGTDNYDWRGFDISKDFWSNPDRLQANAIKISFTITADKALTDNFNGTLYFGKSPWYGKSFTYPKGITDDVNVQLTYSISDPDYSTSETSSMFIRFMKNNTDEYPFVITNAKLEIGDFTPWTPAVEDNVEPKYIGTYTDFTQADSLDPAMYTWSQFKGDDGSQGIPGVNGTSSYTHIAYADDVNGAGFSQEPGTKKYMGMYVDATAADSTDVTKYGWSLIKGSDGNDGIPGKAGADGKTPYLHIAYADSSDGKTGFYVGGNPNFIKNSAAATTIHGDAEHYKLLYDKLTPGTWTFTSNAKYLRGSDTSVFLIPYDNDLNISWAGYSAPIQDGKIRWSFKVTDATEVKLLIYASSGAWATTFGKDLQIDHYKLEQGDVATPWLPSVEDNVQPKYMGTYTDYIQADSSDPSQYLWSQIKGDAGANGKDGQDAYLHIAYANSVDGKTDFTTDQNQAHNRDYLGTYSDNTKAQSTDPTKYTWQLTRGAQGLQGQPGSKDVPVVTMSSTAPASPKDGDFWYQTTTDSSGQKITGFSVYSGGKWVPSKIDQSTLVLTKLVSVEIDSATINSPDITVPFDYFDESQNEYKGSMEFKDGMLKHISTMADGGMLKTVISPTGYTLDAYVNQSEYTKNNPYIHTEVYADNISLSNANTKKSGILDSSGIAGTLNNGTDQSNNISVSWEDVRKHLSEMSETGSTRAFDWFDMMSSVQSHPNLIRNSSFVNGKNNWDTGSAGYVSNDVHDGNFVLQMVSPGGSNFCTQTLANFPWSGNQVCISFWANIVRNDGGVNGGAFIDFVDGGTNYTATIQDAGKGLSTGWKFYSFNPITVPSGTSSIRFAFYNNEHNGNIIHFAQPMLSVGSHVAPYMPTY